MRVALIVPYFGKFPSYFQLVLNSMKINNNIFDWIIFTDDMTEYRYPSNCKVNYCCFEDLKKRIQDKYNFPIKLDNAYKLCDYKPAYGDIFSDELTGYDYWGHCDLDCIFGNLSHFLSDEEFKADRVLRLGHLCMYRNDEQVNQYYKLPVDGRYRYQEVFQNSKNCIFDECNAANEICIDTIWDSYGFNRSYKDDIVANIYYKSGKFQLSTQIDKHNYTRQQFDKVCLFWDHGILQMYAIDDGQFIEKEYGYMHFMRRNMKIIERYDGVFDAYQVVPNKFIEMEHIPSGMEEFKMCRTNYFTNQYFISRYKNLKIKIRDRVERLK